jgi:hypothetical protein
MTMQGIGFTDAINADEFAAVDQALTAGLAGIEQRAVKFRYLTCTRRRSTSKPIPPPCFTPCG